MSKLVNIILALTIVGQAHASDKPNVSINPTSSVEVPSPRVLSPQEKEKRLADYYLLCKGFKPDSPDYTRFLVIGNQCYEALTVQPSQIHRE